MLRFGQRVEDPVGAGLVVDQDARAEVVEVLQHARRRSVRAAGTTPHTQVDDLADLLSLSDAPAKDCAPAHDIARKQLAAVDRRLASLVQLRKELARLVEADDPGQAKDCRVIQVLGDHRLCIGAHDTTEQNVLLKRRLT